MSDEIRLLNSDDANEFKSIRLESLTTDANSWLSSIDEEKDLPTSSFVNKIEYGLTPPHFGFYGYFSDGKLLAYAQISPNYWKKTMHIATLYDVCVSPSARRKAVGSKLIKFMIEKMKTVKGMEQIQLRVTSRNKGAIAFYERIGFTKVATFPDAVKENDGTYQDEFLYCLNIK
jgi:ribosomal protein S18 acetylase RimI-like enzyme